MPTATPASQQVPDPDTGQGGSWLVEDDRARRDQKLRSILRDSGPVPAPRGIIASDEPPEPIAYDYSVVDEEHDHDLRRRGDIKFLIEGAKSLAHLCINLPKNPYCNSCMRAKVNQKQNRRRRGKKHTIEARKFGDSVTGDHLISNGVSSNGIDGGAVGFLLRDHATKFKQLYPAATKSVKEIPGTYVQEQGFHLYTDGAPEIVNAGKSLHACHDTSTPYRSATNGIAEREIRNVLEGTRTLLEHSGLPTSPWPYASRCFCHHANIRTVEGDSAWNRRHKQGHFKVRTNNTIRGIN